MRNAMQGVNNWFWDFLEFLRFYEWLLTLFLILRIAHSLSDESHTPHAATEIQILWYQLEGRMLFRVHRGYRCLTARRPVIASHLHHAFTFWLLILLGSESYQSNDNVDSSMTYFSLLCIIFLWKYNRET